MDKQRKVLLIVLTTILAFNFLDRYAIGLLLQDIKKDLQASDTQLGLLTGLAFAIFYSIMGIPIARLADRGNRVKIIVLTATVWSIAVALCGFAANFAQLVSIRIAVAVGEAGCVPPAHSLIASYFKRAERPRAVAIYMLGAPISAGLGYLVAGSLGEIYGWRVTFVILGLPGLFLALGAHFLLSEPRQSAQAAYEGDAGRSDLDVGVVQSFRILWRIRSYRHLLISQSVSYFFGYGILQWKPAFFMRSFHVEMNTLGAWLAFIYAAGGLLGTYAGGELASRFAAQAERRQLRWTGAAYCGFGTLSIALYSSSNLYVAFALLFMATAGYAMANGPIFATVQSLVPDHLRAMSIAIIYLFSNLIGMGLGPLAAGFLSDILRGSLQDESLRFALLALSPGYFWAAWHLFVASRFVADDLSGRPAGSKQ